MRMLFRLTYLLILCTISGILVQSQSLAMGPIRSIEPIDCVGPVEVMVAAEEDGPYASIVQIPQNHRRYYVDIGVACSTNLAIQVLYCPISTPNCQNPWIINNLWRHEEWGAIRTNSAGIARIDFDVTHHGYYTFRIQPIDLNEMPHPDLWSINSATVLIDGWNTTSIDFRDYFLYEPGSNYQYTTKYYYTPLPNAVLTAPMLGRTRIQIEAERNWAGYTVRHWRYSKDRAEAYWLPYIPLSDGTSLWSGNETLRWPIIAESFDMPTEPMANFDAFVWGLGERRYECIGGCNFDQTAPNPLRWYSVGLRGNASGLVPGLVLGPEQMILPYSYLSYGQNNVTSYSQLDAIPNPGWSCGRDGLPDCKTEHAWRFRVERMPIAVDGFDDVVRIDWYETYAGEDSVLRESWFMARGVGLIKIQQVFFGEKTGRSAATDPDFLSDTIVNPDLDVMLDGAYLPWNRPLVKTSGSSDPDEASPWSCVVRPAPNSAPTFDYHLWLHNTANAGTLEYTGYVSVYNLNTHQLHEKHVWVEQGHAVITLPADVPTGTYRANLNVWHPNDLFPNETFAGIDTPPRVASNDYTIQIVDDPNQCTGLDQTIWIPALMR